MFCYAVLSVLSTCSFKITGNMRNPVRTNHYAEGDHFVGSIAFLLAPDTIINISCAYYHRSLKFDPYITSKP